MWEATVCSERSSCPCLCSGVDRKVGITSGWLMKFSRSKKILALPQYQKDLYTDEEVFGETFPDSVKVLSSDDEDYLKVYDNGIGVGIVFKHPCFHYDNEIFKEWDCGYILGSILIMKDM